MTSSEIKSTTQMGFSNQQALALLVIVFPLGLIGLGSIGVMLLKQPTLPPKAASTQQAPIPMAPPNSDPLPNKNPRKQELANSQTQRLDDRADEIFWRRHPSLKGVKLTQQKGSLAREWAEIRRCEAVIDDRFYRIYPWMRGQTIRPDQQAMATAWQSLHDQEPGCS